MVRTTRISILISMEELQVKSKSKLDLYKLINYDSEDFFLSIVNYFLPSINKCPVVFLIDILNDKKYLSKWDLLISTKK